MFKVRGIAIPRAGTQAVPASACRGGLLALLGQRVLAEGSRWLVLLVRSSPQCAVLVSTGVIGKC